MRVKAPPPSSPSCSHKIVFLETNEISVQAIDVLIDAGADVDDANDDGDTPLHLACLHLQPDSVRTLLRRNADETLSNDDFDDPGDIVGHSVPEDRRDEEVVEWIREVSRQMLELVLKGTPFCTKWESDANIQ